MAAIRAKQCEMAEFLLDNGVDCNFQTNIYVSISIVCKYNINLYVVW